MTSAMSNHGASSVTEARRIIEEGRNACRISMCSESDFTIVFPGMIRPSRKDRKAKSPYRKSGELYHKNVWWLTGFFEEQGRIRALRGAIHGTGKGSDSFAEKCRERGAEDALRYLKNDIIA